MVRGLFEKSWLNVDEYVEVYDLAWTRGGEPELSDFLPDRDHPQFKQIVLELVRVDLEMRWKNGRAKSLDEYRRTFPECLSDAALLSQAAFEEFRARRHAGESPDAQEYADRYGISTADWSIPFSRFIPPLTGGISTTTPKSSTHDERRTPQDVASEFPDVETDLLNFHLLNELGRGRFSRVYLARQGDLANRLVVLKLSTESFAEADKLAQLQHANIVPIYSVHRTGGLFAVCMPYFGARTLADLMVERLAARNVPAADAPKTSLEESACLDDLDKGSTIRLDAIQSNDSTGVEFKRVPATAVVAWSKSTPKDLFTATGAEYVEAVLQLGSQLAEGLAHAHDRGILHRDLKPANILLADDGRPMLLDFNLSEDLKSSFHEAEAVIGGTLPYMAPEQLIAFQQRRKGGDARSDLFSLGVILFELLAGMAPFETRRGPLDPMLKDLINDRLQPAPRLPGWRKSDSPAVEAIVRRCLHPDPAHRYQTAHQLHEDLQRQLISLPLLHIREPSLRERSRKWLRRHPSLTSVTGVAVLAAIVVASLLGALAFRGERLNRLEAKESFRRFQNDAHAAQVQFLEASTSGKASAHAALSLCRKALSHFHVLEDVNWRRSDQIQRLSAEEQSQTAADAGELLFLMAAMDRSTSNEVDASTKPDSLRRAMQWNRQAEACYPADQAPASLWRQRADLAAQLDQHEIAQASLANASTASASLRDECMRACLSSVDRRFREALPLWRKASSNDPRNVWAWYGLGNCYEQIGRPAEAASCYSACIALKPDFGDWYLRRGVAYLHQKDFELASADFDRVITLLPERMDARVNRALARLGQRRVAEAVSDLNEVVLRGKASPRVYFIRSKVKDQIGDKEGAKKDRAVGLSLEPIEESEWIARGAAQVAGEPLAALSSFARALQLNPCSLAALESKAHVLSEKLGRTKEALDVLDFACERHPEQASLAAARGILRARLGQRDPAVAEAKRALALDASGAVRYQVAGVYALTSHQNPQDRREAFAHLASAFQQGIGVALAPDDRDLDPLRDEPDYQKLWQAVQTLRSAFPLAPLTKNPKTPLAQDSTGRRSP